MSHTTEVVRFEKLSNGQFAVHIQCCGNPATEHHHTMAAAVAADPEKRKQSIDEQRIVVAAQHEAALQAEQGLIGEVGVPKVHD